MNDIWDDAVSEFLSHFPQQAAGDEPMSQPKNQSKDVKCDRIGGCMKKLLGPESSCKCDKSRPANKLILAFILQAKPMIDRIGKDRDALRALIEDYQEILESVDDAHREFESAVDRLSQML